MAGLFSTTSSSQTQSNTLGDLKSDVALDNPPEDSISGLAFNPNPADQKDFLAVASWDKKVRIYEILGNGQGQPKAQIEHEGPVLSVDFFKVCFAPLIARGPDDPILSSGHSQFLGRMEPKSYPLAPTNKPR